jgi:hypothetical protein
MTHEVSVVDRRVIRGSDSNSLLRLYDQAAGVRNSSKLQEERSRADKALQRIAKELRKREVKL